MGSPAVASRINFSSAVTTVGSFFFEPHSATSLVANAASRVRRRVKQLLLAASDRISTQPRNASQFGKAASPLLTGEESDIETPAFFVEGSDQLIDQLMLSGNRSLRVELTRRTGTHMDTTTAWLCHKNSPSTGENGGKAIVGRNGQVVFRRSPPTDEATFLGDLLTAAQRRSSISYVRNLIPKPWQVR